MDHCSSTSSGDQQWISFRTLTCILGLLIHAVVPSVAGTECIKRKYTVGFFAIQRNATLKCTMSFQWTVNDFCCYDRYDRNEDWPYCCYSEAYKLALAVGFICLVLLGSSFCLFCCWFYNLPHHVLYIITCHKFRLDDWLEKSRNGPYVDPSFYSGEPFWAGGDVQPYPLRPMPPRIFYPAPPPNMKFRWEMGQGDMPLFILASRQFHRNPYSARPNDRNTNVSHANSHSLLNQSSHPQQMFPDSRRSSVTTLSDAREGTAPGGRGSSNGRRSSNSGANSSAPAPFKINIDEAQAKSELIEAVRIMEEKSDDPELEESVRKGSGQGNLRGDSSRPSSCEQSGGYRTTGGENETHSSRDSDSSGGPSSSYSQQGSSGSNSRGKVSVEVLNQQLSSSLGLSINNLPNVHVIGNFGSGMETIEEDDGPFDDGEMDYYPTPPFTPPLLSSATGARGGLSKVPPSRAPSAATDDDRRETWKRSRGTQHRHSIAQSERIPRISSALDRIVTRARAEVPFRPSLPGSIPENSSADLFSGSCDRDTPDEAMRKGLSNMRFDEEEFDTRRRGDILARRNSAPVNF